MSKPSILITNLSLCARTGSELHVLELARQFKASGWDVTCFTLVYAYPLKREFETSGIEVVEFGSEELLRDHYDVFFAQHHVVSEHIWNIGRISFGTVLISILGVVDQQEGLPRFWNSADGFVFVSEETRSKVCDSYAIDVPTLVFPNYAPKQFFSSMERVLPESPHRIAVFSNHPPEEILSLSSCHVSGDPTIDIFGTQTISVELTPQLLEQYDVVVSIGRTAQCCLALGIPFFATTTLVAQVSSSPIIWSATLGTTSLDDPSKRSLEQLSSFSPSRPAMTQPDHRVPSSKLVQRTCSHLIASSASCSSSSPNAPAHMISADALLRLLHMKRHLFLSRGALTSSLDMLRPSGRQSCSTPQEKVTTPPKRSNQFVFPTAMGPKFRSTSPTSFQTKRN